MTVTKQKSSSAYNEANKAYLKSELRCITKNHGGATTTGTVAGAVGGVGVSVTGVPKLAPGVPSSKPIGIAKQRLSFGDDEDCCSSGGDEDIVSEDNNRGTCPHKSDKKSLEESRMVGEEDNNQSHNIKKSTTTSSSSSSSLLTSLLSTKPLCDSISDALLVFGDLSCGDDEKDSNHNEKGEGSPQNIISISDNNNSFLNNNGQGSVVGVMGDEQVNNDFANSDNNHSSSYCELEGDEEEDPLSCEDDSGSSTRSTSGDDNDEGENSHPAMDEDDNDPDNRDKLFCTEHIGNVLMDEFDGTTVLCRVCGDKASGFHYGVHSCEGCKGFFRRSIQQKIQYRPCTKNQQCSILRVNRNRCQYCRLKKCIAVGMSRDAVRFGRVPKREKAKILAAMQQSHQVKVSERALSAELEDTSKLTNAVVRAHMETCEFTKDKVQKCYNTALIKKEDQGNSKTQNRIGHSSEITLACPLNPHPQSTTEDFSQRFSPAIRGVVEFAKRLPGFSIMSQDDQVTLLKAGVFEILLVRLACMFKGNTMLCINGELLERETISAHQNARFLLDSMFKFAEQFNKLGLSDEQIGLFCAVVVMAPDRPGLRNVELVTRLQSHFRSALHSLVPAYVVQELDRKIPDLRTLNTLHSEKLLAFKMEEQAFEQQQHQQPQIRSSSVETMDTSNSTPPYEHMHHHHQDSSSSSSSTSSTTVSISPRRLSNNSSNGSCPYKSFQRGLESPSGDSGIESGACSSPARSEQDLPLIEERGREHHGHQRMEDMPVLKRALQAPPIVDTNVLMNEAYRVHKKFRYSITDKHSSSSSTSSTPTPPTYSSSTSSTSSSPPPPPSPSHTYSPSISPYRPQSHALQPPHTPQTSLSPPPPPPHQLYPQLASALTNPRSSSSSSSSGGESSYHHHHPIHHHAHQFKSPLQLQHSTLAMKLNEKPKHMTEDQQVTSELLHSIIMRGGAADDDDEVEDEIVRRGQQQQQAQQQSASSNDSSQVPLNLSKKIAC